MRLAGRMRITLAHFRVSWRVYLVAVMATVMAASAIALVGALWVGLSETVTTHVLGRLPVGVIEVTRSTLQLGPFAFQRPSFLSGGVAMDDDGLRALRRIDGVEWVEGEATLPLPVRAEGELFGRKIRTDLTVSGISTRLAFDDEARRAKFVDPYAGGPEPVNAVNPASATAVAAPREPELGDREIPALVSTGVFELFNTNIAPSLGFPQVTEEALSSIAFKLTVGRAGVMGQHKSGKVVVLPARLAGASARALTLGVTLPLPVVTALMKYFGEGESMTYTRFYVKVADASKSSAVTAEVEKLGFTCDATQKLMSGVITLGMSLPGAFAVLLLLVSSLGLAQAFSLLVTRRRSEIALWRAVGATRRDVLGLVLGESVLVGVVGGLLGLMLAHGAAAGLSMFVASQPLTLPFPFEALFAFTGEVEGLTVVFAVVSCLAGAFVPALRASRLNPVTAFRG